MKSLFKKIIIFLLTLEARAVLKKYRPKVIAVTGSVGKTSTKDAIFSLLANGTHVRKSEKSFNTEFGVPLTILGVPNAWNNPIGWVRNLFDGLFLIVFKTRYPEWLVLEVGADRPGDISSIATWLKVDVAVMTRLPEVPVHVEFFDSPEAVIEEKASLIRSLKEQGVLVLYAGDREVGLLKHRAGEKRVITFGLKNDADVRAEEVRLLFEEGKARTSRFARSSPDASQSEAFREQWPVGIKANLVTRGVTVPVEVVGACGAHALLPALAAAAVGVALDKKVEHIMRALERYDPPPGRMHLLRGIKDTLIIDDTYNSSPAAVEAALDTLAEVGAHARTRRVAVLGDMLELGRHSAAEHKKVGAHAAKTSDLLLTVGFRARDIAEGALDAGMSEKNILQYEDARRAGRELKNLLKQKDVVLVKGSQSIRTERIVEEIMLEPERAEKLLVRQDAEWRKR